MLLSFKTSALKNLSRMIKLWKDSSFAIIWVDTNIDFGCTESFLLEVTFNIVKLDDYEYLFNQSTCIFKESVRYLVQHVSYGRILILMVEHSVKLVNLNVIQFPVMDTISDKHISLTIVTKYPPPE